MPGWAGSGHSQGECEGSALAPRSRSIGVSLMFDFTGAYVCSCVCSCSCVGVRVCAECQMRSSNSMLAICSNKFINNRFEECRAASQPSGHRVVLGQSSDARPRHAFLRREREECERRHATRQSFLGIWVSLRKPQVHYHRKCVCACVL